MKKYLGLVLLIILILFIGCESMKDLYLSEVRKELIKYPNFETDIITDKDISSLPEPTRIAYMKSSILGIFP